MVHGIQKRRKYTTTTGINTACSWVLPVLLVKSIADINDILGA